MKFKQCNNKISIVSQTLSGGGAERVAVNLANHYASIGYNVDLVVFHLSGPYQSLVNFNVNIVNLNIPRARYSYFKLRSYLKKNIDAMCLSVIRDANIFLGLASIGLKSKNITYREANTLDSIEKQGGVKRNLYKFIMKISYSRANYIIANSDDTKLDLVKNKIAGPEKIKVIRNPVLTSDIELLKSKDVNEEWFSQKNNKIILSVGRLHHQKNFPFLISAFKEIYKKRGDTRLIIVGEGEERQRLASLIEKLGLSSVVKLVDFQNNIYPYYNNSTVFALSSDWEGFGNVIVEALSVGLPVVSTNCPGGPKMILESELYGQLVPVGDKKGYVDAILKLLENPRKRPKSIEYAKRFTVENVADEYLEVLKSPPSS